MKTPTFTVACLSSQVIAHDVYEIRVQRPENFSFRAGQFVLFDVPLVNQPTDIQPRAYSIASAPHEADLLFVIKLVAGGRASRWVEESLRPGTSFVMKGPFGVFCQNAQSVKERVLICTSTGIAPFRSQILSAIHTGELHTTDLVFGVRSEQDLFWLKELTALAKEYPQIRVSIALTRPGKDWKGLTGRVQIVTRSIIADFQNTVVYACGNPDMTKDIKRLCLEEWGMAKTDVHVEGYI